MAKKLSKAQMKIAKLAKPFDKITKEDFVALRAKRDNKGEPKKPMKFGDKKIKGGPIRFVNFKKPLPRKHEDGHVEEKKPIFEKEPIFERQEFPIKSGRFKGLNEEEYKAEIMRLRRNKKERDKKQKK
jgi:hypothetical protein